MKISRLFIQISFVLLLLGCSSGKVVVTLNDLAGDKMLIIGLVEYDYSQLQNKNISGIEFYIDSKEKYKDFVLPTKDLLNQKTIRQEFISIIGSHGDYDLCFRKSDQNSPESDNLLIVLNMERDMASSEKSVWQKYSINDGKIINIGKLVVSYLGGTVEDSRIRYSYTFNCIDNDTLAMYALKQNYPEIYSTYKDDIYVFKSEFESCIEYILSRVSEEKRLRIEAFMKQNPHRITLVFFDLSPITQDKYITQIENFTLDELEMFLASTSPVVH